MKIAVDPASCFSSGLSTTPEENKCHTIDVADRPFGRGGQGEIYPVSHIDGKKVSGLLVKVFYQGFPPGLKYIVTTVRDHNKTYNIDQCIALRALPLFCFTGKLQRKAVHGYVMREVSGEPFSRIIEDDINTYINLPLEDRLTFCLHFVEGMHILYSLTLVHADINGQNLLIDTTNQTLTIIDLDGGTVASTGTAPVVIGKPEPGWLAPEIVSQLAKTTSRQQIEVGIQVDLWSIACGVHHLLFGLAPFFFIARQPEIARYLQNYKWPQLRGLHGIATTNDHAFSYYERAYQQVPELHRLLEFSFQKGYLDPAQRPTAYQWIQGLGSQQQQVMRSPRQSVIPRPRPRQPTVTCPQCGQDNTPDAIYCHHCANQLARNQQCPYGNHQTPVHAQYCPVCGGSLGRAAVSSPPRKTPPRRRRWQGALAIFTMGLLLIVVVLGVWRLVPTGIPYPASMSPPAVYPSQLKPVSSLERDDAAQGVDWYRQAAEQRDAEAQFHLGWMYEKGQGVERDYAQAAHWYRQAAEQGLAMAQNNLGNLYYQGQGVERDYAQAMHWYRQAAEQENARGQINLGWMYEKGQGVERDYAQAIHWYRQAAEQGLTGAKDALEHGLTTGKDIWERGLRTTKEIWERGLATAKTTLEQLKKQE